MGNASFYGGNQGRSFEVKQIFGNKVEMMLDCAQRWNSEIAIGDYVFISYGDPNDSTIYANGRNKYQYNKFIDLNSGDKKTWNSTLWRKVFTSDTEGMDTLTGLDIYYVDNDLGIGYQLVASLVGTTPEISVKAEIVNPNVEPSISVDNSNGEAPVWTIKIPRSQVMTDIVNIAENASVEPYGVLKYKDDTTKINPYIELHLPQAQIMADIVNVVEHSDIQPYGILRYKDESSKNEPYIELHLPDAQTISKVEKTTLNASQEPTVVMVYDDDTKSSVSFTFGLPQAQMLNEVVIYQQDVGSEPSGLIKYDESDEESKNNPNIILNLPATSQIRNITRRVEDANVQPSVDTTTSGEYNEIIDLNFRLPQAQLMQAVEDIQGATNSEFSCTLKYLNSDINKPYLEIHHPKTVEFNFGTTVPTEATELSNGDFYINSFNGNVYRSNGSSYEKIACFARTIDQVNTNIIAAYRLENGQYILNTPSVSNDINDGYWNVDFSIPKAPDVMVNEDVTILNSTQNPILNGEVIDENTYRINFSLPRAARWFTGSAISSTTLDATITDALTGDYYLNTSDDKTSNGHIYLLAKSGKWVDQGSIKGKTGDAVKIVAAFDYENSSTTSNNYTTLVFSGSGKIYNSSDLNTFGTIAAQIATNNNVELDDTCMFRVNYTEPSNPTQNAAYFLFKTSLGTWQTALVTGSISGLLADEYITENTDNKTYNATYINEQKQEIDNQFTSVQENIESLNTTIEETVNNSLITVNNQITALQEKDDEIDETLNSLNQTIDDVINNNEVLTTMSEDIENLKEQDTLLQNTITSNLESTNAAITTTNNKVTEAQNTANEFINLRNVNDNIGDLRYIYPTTPNVDLAGYCYIDAAGRTYTPEEYDALNEDGKSVLTRVNNTTNPHNNHVIRSISFEFDEDKDLQQADIATVYNNLIERIAALESQVYQLQIQLSSN